MVRVFEDPDIIHVENRVDPKADIAIIDLELIFKDLDTVTKRLEGTIRQARGGDKAALIQKEVLELLQHGLEAGTRAAAILGKDDREEVIQLMNELSLLTAKPRIVVFNASEEQVQNRWQPPSDLRGTIGSAPCIVLSAKVEDELNSLAPDEKAEYLRTLGLETSGLDRMIALGYETLSLQTFLTTGEDETRAWTVPSGSSAPRAGRAIHSDFEQKFIRAEVVAYEKLIEARSFAKARELGQVRIEGKEYIVQDGDVIEFRI